MKSLSLIMFMVMSVVTSTIGINPKRVNRGPYEIIKGRFDYAAVERGGLPSYYADTYFSQSYFEHPSTEFDSHLATASLCFAISTFVTTYDPLDPEFWYLNQSRYAKEYFEAIQFNSFMENEDYRKSATIDTIGLCAAKKEFNGYTVVAIAPRSGGYFGEWASNVHLGDGSKSDYMHEGWYNAANKLIDFANEYVVTNNVTGRVKLWMAGYSRGGATTNIAAGLIDNKLINGEKIFSNGAYTSREDVYAYTFEAPQGANVNAKTVKAPKDAIYNNIFNIVNPSDIVPKLAMKEYGFTRFGIDKFVTNEFYQPSDFSKNRRTFYALHDVFNIYKGVKNVSDEFKMLGFSITNVGAEFFAILYNTIINDMDFSEAVKKLVDNTKANYDFNIASNILLEELTGEMGNRKTFVNKYQKPLETLLTAVTNEATGLDTPISTLIKMFFICAIYDIFSDPQKALDEMVDSWGEEVGAQAYILIKGLIGPIVSTYWERPNELLSIGLYSYGLMQNHYPDITLAHVASQDSYYVDTYNQSVSEQEKLSLVPFMDNADYGRMKFFGFNDIGLRLESKKGTRVININGHVVGKSDVDDCRKGYAAGYYSYITEEKMELFMPINTKYNISMKSYSKKPYHRCEYWAYYEYIVLDNRGKVRVELDHKKTQAVFNSDRYKRDVTIKL